MYDYLLGGKDHYHADRLAAEKIVAVAPEIVDGARANRRFLTRAVRYLAEEKGIRQFLDIGTGIPTAGNTHQVAPGHRARIPRRTESGKMRGSVGSNPTSTAV